MAGVDRERWLAEMRRDHPDADAFGLSGPVGAELVEMPVIVNLPPDVHAAVHRARSVLEPKGGTVHLELAINQHEQWSREGGLLSHTYGLLFTVAVCLPAAARWEAVAPLGANRLLTGKMVDDMVTEVLAVQAEADARESSAG